MCIEKHVFLPIFPLAVLSRHDTFVLSGAKPVDAKESDLHNRTGLGQEDFLIKTLKQSAAAPDRTAHTEQHRKSKKKYSLTYPGDID